jgi:tRNA(Ser,Leu) C12 N-acetylase TAN1
MATQSLRQRHILMVIAPSDFRDEELLEPKARFEAEGAIVETASTGTGIARGWNVVITSREGARRRLRRALARLVRLERSGFRSVFVARVDEPQALLEAVEELRTARPALDQWLGKIIPVERTFAVDPATFQGRVQEEAAHFVDRLAGRSFHVRIERRGHKGTINSHACEQALGAFLWVALEQRGARPVVEFHDPDVVLVVEVVGDTAGMGLVTRELRTRFPFVRIA